QSTVIFGTRFQNLLWVGLLQTYGNLRSAHMGSRRRAKCVPVILPTNSGIFGVLTQQIHHRFNSLMDRSYQRVIALATNPTLSDQQSGCHFDRRYGIWALKSKLPVGMKPVGIKREPPQEDVQGDGIESF